ncbi:MAG: type II toxin-antitoxin system Phd/YefM family antitoxin [bacterium]|nr:type II toxin-antitoxin system Phd/YefM family antitoxin [bacterium]
MKTISACDAQRDLQRVLDSAQEERVVITRDGKPVAVVFGLGSVKRRTCSLPAPRISGG